MNKTLLLFLLKCWLISQKCVVADQFCRNVSAKTCALVNQKVNILLLVDYELDIAFAVKHNIIGYTQKMTEIFGVAKGKVQVQKIEIDSKSNVSATVVVPIISRQEKKLPESLGLIIVSSSVMLERSSQLSNEYRNFRFVFFTQFFESAHIVSSNVSFNSSFARFKRFISSKEQNGKVIEYGASDAACMCKSFPLFFDMAISLNASDLTNGSIEYETTDNIDPVADKIVVGSKADDEAKHSSKNLITLIVVAAVYGIIFIAVLGVTVVAVVKIVHKYSKDVEVEKAANASNTKKATSECDIVRVKGRKFNYIKSKK